MSPLIISRWILSLFFAAFEGVACASQVSASSGQFTLQVVTGGTVWAWGANGSGQLGDGTFVNHAVAEPVLGITSVIAVAAGGSHSVVLKSDGTVWAWGSNSNGQLGDGTFNFHPIPNQVPGLAGIVAIAAGQSHSLALKSDGTLWAWGANGNGQLGDGTTIQRLSPVAVSTTGFTNNIVVIAAGANHSLAIASGGAVWAWGLNGSGQVGDGTSVNKLAPTTISLVTCAAGAATAIAGGNGHSLAVVGGVVCAWGLNGNGELGDGTTTNRSTAVATSGLTGITAVSAGAAHSLALKSDNTVWAWGGNAVGDLGDTTTTDQHVPVQSVGVVSAIEIAAGGNFSVARLSSPVDGVMTWGIEVQGALGDGITALRPVPLEISGLSGVTQAAAGNGFTLALLNGGTIVGLGANANGQLGDNSTTRRLAPVAVSGLTNITAIAGGNSHSLALRNDGTVWAWGFNANGQLGNNTTTQEQVPAQVVGVGGSGFLTNIAGISASGTNNYSAAVNNTGVLYAWGLNNTGQLGDGTTTQRIAPVVVTGLSGIFTAVSAGNNHTLALRNDGTVWAWGNNNSGQLGIGTSDFTVHSTPAQVPGLTGVVAISAGNASSFALKGDGSVWAWGQNYSDSGTFANPIPTENMDLPGVLSFTAGSGYALFTIQIGSVKWVGGWGGNSGGQLGNGTFNFGGNPLPTLGFAGKTASSVSANSHSLAVMTDGTVWGWGIDNNGQLGDNPTIFNPTPTAPVGRGAPDLTVTKTHVGDFSAGLPGSYTITVTNVGQASMSGPITVMDTLPAGMSFASGTGSGWTCSAVSGGASCSNPSALGAGASSVITLNVNSTSLMFPDQFNLATVSSANDPQALNNTSGDETSASTPTTITLTAAPTPNPSTFGKPVSLTATVTPSAAPGFVTFFDGPAFLGTAAVTSGTARLNTIMIGAGPRQLGAIFVPNPLSPYNYGFTAPPTSQTVSTIPSASLTPSASSPLVLGGSKSGYLAATGDFNGDGILDVAAVDGGLHSVTIYLGNGTGGFTPSSGGPFQAGTSPVAILATDLNRDGKVDLAIANQGVNTLTVLLGNGAGAFTAAPGSPFAAGFTPTSLVVGNTNQDGSPVVELTGLTSTQITRLKRDPFGNFYTDSEPIPSGSRSGITVGDFNGDGSLDLALSDTSGTVGILLKGNTGYNPLVSIPSTLPHPQGILSAYLNNDTSADLVAWDPTGIEVLLGNGSGGFAEASGSPFVPGTGAIIGISSVSVGDFNGDGILDLFVVRTPSVTAKGELVIMLGNGSGGFTQAAGAGYSAVASNLQNAVVGEFNGDGRTDVAVTDPGNDAVLVLQGVTASPVSAAPASGSGLTQTFTFNFNAPNGWQSIGVLDVLMNNFLDGIGACYVAFVPTTSAAGFLYLVDDAGDAGGPFSSTTFPSTGTVQNSQCSIAATGSSFLGSGNTLTLKLVVTFKAAFAGNKVFYMAAQDTNSVSSGWHALGTWSVPGAAPTGPSVSGVTPARGTGVNQTLTFTLTDTNGFADISIVDVLINNFLDGIGACYVAYVPSINTLILVDDAGDAGGPYAGTLPGSSSISNSQCTVHSAGSSVVGSGNTVSLTLNLTFNNSFAGDRVIYAAAGSNSANSGWLAVGTVSVP